MRHYGLAGLLLAAMMAWAGSALGQTFALRIGHVAPASEMADDHVAALFLKTYIESRSGGRMQVEIFPASQLGDLRALVEQVQLGTLEAAHTSIGGIGQFLPEIQVLELPYVIPDDQVAERVARSGLMLEIRDAVLKKTGNVRLLSATNTGRFRSFFTTRKPILEALDLKGLRMRTVDSPAEMEFVRFFGGTPVPVAWAELYAALKAGAVDGSKTAATDVIPANMQDTLKFVVLDEHAYLWGFNWVSDKWLKSLPKDLQELVADAFAQMGDVQAQYNKRYEGKSLELFIRAGGKVQVPTPEQKATFVTGRDHMKAWFADKYGKEWVEKLDRAVVDAQAAIGRERSVWLGR